jgi:hypothetical protein
MQQQIIQQLGLLVMELLLHLLDIATIRMAKQIDGKA